VLSAEPKGANGGAAKKRASTGVRKKERGALWDELWGERRKEAKSKRR